MTWAAGTISTCVRSEFGPDNDERKALRLDAEWRIGEHTLRFGYDDETFTSRIAGAEYSGGVFYRRYTPVDFEDSWNGVDIPADAHVVRKRTRTSPSGSYEVKNSAALFRRQLLRHRYSDVIRRYS